MNGPEVLARTMAGTGDELQGPAGFESFFSDEHVRLYRALFLLTGRTEEAEELMQEAFLRVWERWDRVVKMDRPAGYLYRTALNVWRSRVRRATRAARERVFRGSAAQDPYPATDDRLVVLRALASVPPRQRAALVLTDLLDMKAEDAAAMLRVQPATVRSLASHARAALRQTLGVADV